MSTTHNYMPKNIENKSIAIFEDELIRRVWSEKDKKWYFSNENVVSAKKSRLNIGS
jgi:hypothetical protein